jgi:hypothetical protein
MPLTLVFISAAHKPTHTSGSGPFTVKRLDGQLIRAKFNALLQTA